MQSFGQSLHRSNGRSIKINSPLSIGYRASIVKGLYCLQTQKWELEHAQLDEEDYANSRLLEDLLKEQVTSGDTSEMEYRDSRIDRPEDTTQLSEAVGRH